MNDRKHTIMDNEVAPPSPNRKKQVEHATTPEQVAGADSLQGRAEQPTSSNKSKNESSRKDKSASLTKRASRGIGKWTKKEDQRLLEIIQKDQSFAASLDMGQNGNWANIASQLNNGRSSKQCRDRWLNYLRPGIKKGDWTAEEEELIRELHDTFGARWSAMAKMLPNRTDNDIKNKWYSMFRAQERMELKAAQRVDNTKISTQKKSTPASNSPSSKHSAKSAKQTPTPLVPSHTRTSRPSSGSMPVKKRPPRPTRATESLNADLV